MKLIYFIILSALVTGCASLSKEDCETTNWNSAGYAAASKGIPAGTQIAHFKKLCVDKYNTKINTEDFTTGYQQGLALYCTDKNLYDKGVKGGVYQGVCDQTNSKSVTSYTNGRIVFLENQVQELEDENRDLKSKVSDLESKISDLESKLRSNTQ